MRESRGDAREFRRLRLRDEAEGIFRLRRRRAGGSRNGGSSPRQNTDQEQRHVNGVPNR